MLTGPDPHRRWSRRHHESPRVNEIVKLLPEIESGSALMSDTRPIPYDFKRKI